VEKHTTTADSKRADLSLPRCSSVHSLSLSERLGVSAVRVLGCFFLRARWRANFFLFFSCEYFSTREVSLLFSHRASAAARKKREFWEVKSRTRFLIGKERE